jgi:uncharacterized protein with von Willebrand factor type A (vWA) domain
MSIPTDSLAAVPTSASAMPRQSVQYQVDLPRLATAFGQRLHDARVPVTPDQTLHYARALALTAAGARRGLYTTTRAVFVTDMDQLAAFNSIFAQAFGARGTSEDDDFEVELRPALPASY